MQARACPSQPCSMGTRRLKAIKHTTQWRQAVASTVRSAVLTEPVQTKLKSPQKNKRLAHSSNKLPQRTGS